MPPDAGVAVATVGELVIDDRDARRVVLDVTARRTLKSGLIWGAAFGFIVLAVAAGYTTSFPTEASRQKLAQSFNGNSGVAALLGPARQLETVAGYTAWRTMGILSVAGAVWGLLLATRVTRGEEDAGRWELLLTGPTTRARSARDVAAALALAWGTLWLLTALLTVVVGRSSSVGFSTGDSLYLAAAACASAAIFLTVGMLTAQLGSTRRQANLLGAAVLGVSYLVRMIADSVNGLGGLRWASPLGWVEELRPLIDPRPLAALPIVALVVVVGVVAVNLAERRDVGSGLLTLPDEAVARTGLLRNQLTLSARLVRPAVLAWTAGLVVLGFVLGLVATAAAEAVSGSTVIEDALSRLGARASGAAAYLGLTFLIATAMVAFAAAGHVASARDEEADGRLDNVLVRPLSRARWLAGRLSIAAGFVVAAGVLTGVAAWIGAASQHTGIGFGSLVEAGVNAAPPALIVLGIGTLVFGVWPRAATAATYAVVAWSVVVELVGSVTTTNGWLLDTSVFHHVAPAPATNPDWTAAAVMVIIGALAAVGGIVAFDRRDLASA